MRILNLGAGVQSSTVLMMMHAREIKPADVAIFADTGWEPAAVYTWLDWLEALNRAADTGIVIERVTAGNIRSDALDPEHRFASMPLHVLNQAGTKGMVRRQCTSEYKIKPIRRRIRERMTEAGIKGGVVQVFGISADEPQRMRDPDVKYIASHEYPLVDLRMTRHDCYRWLDAHGYPRPPRSACIGCPFHSDHEWRSIKENPAEWADAVEFDTAIRDGNTRLGKASMRGKVYLHGSLKPLGEVDLSTEEDRGQQSLFLNDCQGMCGV